jgi:hypothetical protein
MRPPGDQDVFAVCLRTAPALSWTVSTPLHHTDTRVWRFRHSFRTATALRRDSLRQMRRFPQGNRVTADDPTANYCHVAVRFVCSLGNARRTAKLDLQLISSPTEPVDPWEAPVTEMLLKLRP